MNRRYRLALRAWPLDYRTRYSDDLIDTALELNNGKFSWRELVSLVANGIGARHLAATAGNARRSIDDAVLVGFMLFMTSVLGEILHRMAAGARYGVADWPETRNSMLAYSAIGLAALATVRARTLAVVITALVAASWFWGPASMARPELAAYSVASLAPLWWLARANRRTGLRVAAAALAWVGLLVAVGLGLGSYYIGHDWLVLVVLIVGAAFSPFDPRLLGGALVYLATRLLVTSVGILNGPSWGLGADQPAVQIGVMTIAVVLGVPAMRRVLV